MNINKGVEWAAHACFLLTALPKNWTLSAQALAEFHDVPPAYMAKQMQALSRAGLVKTSTGRKGGYSLAKESHEISMWDIMAAIEGTNPTFRCTEVRQKGPCGITQKDCTTPCAIAKSFYKAEEAFRTSLQATPLSQVIQSVADISSKDKVEEITNWIEANAMQP